MRNKVLNNKQIKLCMNHQCTVVNVFRKYEMLVGVQNRTLDVSTDW